MSALRTVVTVTLAALPGLASAQELLSNGSFESPEAVCGVPTTFGDWGVDAAMIVPAEAGVTPYDGSQMLRLEFPFFLDNGLACIGVAGGASADVAQLTDVSSCHPAGTSATLRFSAWFNRSPNGGTDQYSCILRAYDGVPVDVLNAPILAEASTPVAVGTSTAWVGCETELSLPAGATYVSTYVSARVVGGPREVYADAASLVPIVGRCGFDCTALGATCPDPSSPSTATQCDTATGVCVECLADGDCDDGNECTDDVCMAGTCSSTTTAAGTPCSSGVCLDEACVQCTEDLHCGLGFTCDQGTNTCSMIDIDAGVEDTGVPEDATVADASLPDLGPPDTGPSPDLGARDTGAVADAGGRDAGVVADAGSGADAGPETTDEGGCDCRSTELEPHASLAGAALVLLAFARRRRSGSRR